MARTPFVPSPAQQELVEMAAACGLPQAQLRRRIRNPQTGVPISEKTLRRAFRAELDRGMAVANAAVAYSLYKLATGQGPAAVAAARFWLQCRADWRPAPSPAEQFSGLGQGAVEGRSWP